jgi:hypothetical protein
MADFCKQCSIANFGEDHGDLRGLSDKLQMNALCEGCGPTFVDPNGKCVYEFCREYHGLVR